MCDILQLLWFSVAITNALSALFYMHTVYCHIYLYVLCCVFNYDYLHIFGSMECVNNLQITTFTALSDVKFLCFITLSTSFSHFTVGRPHLQSCDQVIIHLGHLLSSMCTTCPYRFKMSSSILSKVVCVTHIFMADGFISYSY